jgi:hypothetical protein
MNPTAPDTVDEPRGRGSEAAKCFWISFFLLAVPVAGLCWLYLMEDAPTPHRHGKLVLLTLEGLWAVSGLVGLFFGVRSARLADRKSDGYGILAVLLHVCSLFLLGCINVWGASGG